MHSSMPQHTAECFKVGSEATHLLALLENLHLIFQPAELCKPRCNLLEALPEQVQVLLREG